MRLLLVAGRFLTRLPLPAVTIRHGDLAAATGLFPLVGVVVASLATVGWAIGWLVGGATVAAVLAVGTATAVTGAFHDDGLADVADGWFGGWDPAGRLAIMRDSRVGTFGAVALALAVLLEVSLLAAPWTAVPGSAASVPTDPVAATATAWLLLVAGHAIGRSGILVARRVAPVADAGSLSTLVAAPPDLAAPGHGVASGRVPELLGLATAVGVAVVVAGWWAPAVLTAVVATAVGTARWSVAKVGGLTGDALGATARLCQLVALAGVVAVARHG